MKKEKSCHNGTAEQSWYYTPVIHLHILCSTQPPITSAEGEPVLVNGIWSLPAVIQPNHKGLSTQKASLTLHNPTAAPVLALPSILFRQFFTDLRKNM